MYAVASPEEFDSTNELGMGYHFGMRKNGRTGQREGLIVLNGSVALTPNDIMQPATVEKLRILADTENKVPIHEHARQLLQPVAVEPSEDIRLLKDTFAGLTAWLQFNQDRVRIHESPPFQVVVTASQCFVRFSAFQNDRRVLPGGGLLPGTYVTTRIDADRAPSGLAAVGRYALPNPLPAIYRFEIVPKSGLTGMAGTVSPAFGQAGGGVEIEFKNAAPHGSVTGPSTIPMY
jgi:hypothetical protein